MTQAPLRGSPSPLAAGDDDRYLLISADCHAGGNHEAYRSYLDPAFLGVFDQWRARYTNPFRDLQGDGRSRNWDSPTRIAELEADGIVGEVVFPNTVPPFFPTGALVARPPRPDQYARRLAGIRAHNRWLADWCAREPLRRAGVAQIFLNNLDDAITDVHFAKEHGLRGGILLPAVPPDCPDLVPLYDPHYDPLWAVCQDLEVPVNHHSGGGAPDYGTAPSAGVMWISEAAFFSRRALTHLLMSGVFERFPRLTFVMTETGGSWVPPLLDQLDLYHRQMRDDGRIGELKFTPEQVLADPPSVCFARCCRIAVSFPSPTEAAARTGIGVDRFLWGSDYPHNEGTFPHTLEGLRRAFAGVAPEEVQQLVAGNTADVYGFDLAALRPIADRVGPRVTDVARPLDAVPQDSASPAFLRA